MDSDAPTSEGTLVDGLSPARIAMRHAGGSFSYFSKLLVLLMIFVVASSLLLPAAAFARGPVSVALSSADAAYNLYQRRVFDINTTLHCERTTSVAGTADGALWIGTYDGVYRFDGRDMTPVDLGAVHAVNCLYTDADDNLWVGTNDNGIAVVKDQRLVATLKAEGGLPSDTVKALAGDAEGRVYAGTSDTVAVLSLEKHKDGTYTIAVDEKVASVERPVSIAAAADTSGIVAAADEDGFLLLLQDGTAVDTVLPGDDFQYCAVAFDGDSTLYAGRDDGRIDVFDVSQGRLEKSDQLYDGKASSINALYLADGTLFVCTEDGLACKEGDSFTWLEADGFTDSVLSVGKDFQGNLWFASPRIGLMELYRSPAMNLFQAAGLAETVVNTETEWGGLLYIGTDRGLECVDPATHARADNALSDAVSGVPVQCLLADSQGNLWICTFGEGLIRVAPDGAQTTYTEADDLFDDKTRMAIELSDGRIAVCGNDGISIISQDGTIEDTLVRQTGNAPVLCLMEEDDGSLLAGTDGDGLAVIEGGSVTRILTKEDGLSYNTVRRLTQSQLTGTVYAVTNSGISTMPGGGDYEVKVLEHFPSVNNYNVRILDHGTALIPGSDGLYVCREEDLLADGKDLDYQLLNDEWGISAALTADACNYIDADNNFYLASSVGAYVVNLKDYDQIDVNYRLSVDKALLDDKEVPVDAKVGLTIGSGVQRVSVEPELMNFNVTDPDIRYYLEGYDKQKTTVPYSQLRDITYTNLPAGTYALHLEVLDSSGAVQAKQTYQLVKEKKLTDRPWFWALIVAGTLALGFQAAWTWANLNNKRQMRKKEEQLEMANEGVMAIAKALDKRDKYTSQHSERVSLYSGKIGAKLGMSEEECENLRKVALLHDIGKIGVPDKVLNKPGRLTDEEYAIIKKHVDYGAEILQNFTGLDHVVEGAQYHHERYDGKGYTHGLKGEEIPLYGRIIGVADAFDAMTSNRVYRGHLDIEEVLGELERCRGTQFDPHIADIMIELVKSGGIDLSELYGDVVAQRTPDEEKKDAEEQA